MENESLPAQQPPPPLPEVTLTHLFQQQMLHKAVEHLRSADSALLRQEIIAAFAALPSAPSCFLQCINLYAQERDVMSILGWIGIAVGCMQLKTHDRQLTDADRQLAASILPTFAKCRMSFVSAFALAYQIEPQELSVFCANMLGSSVTSAVQLMESLQMKYLLPPTDVLLAAIEQDDIHAADKFVRGNKEHQMMFVNLLITRNAADKVIKRRISMFKMDPTNFPEYHERKQKRTLHFLIRSQQYEDALKFVDESKNLQSYACKLLVHQKGVDDPVTRQFVYRLGLSDLFHEVDISGEEGNSLPIQSDFSPLDTCISLADVIGENNIIFVDTLTALQSCIDHLMTQQVIGFDTEWKAVHVAASANDSPNSCALLQLASETKAFVIDVLALQGYGPMLSSLFISNQIVKLGFDTKGDVKALRYFLAPMHNGNTVVVSKLLDIQVVARKLLLQGVVDISKDDNTMERNEGGDQSKEDVKLPARTNHKRTRKNKGKDNNLKTNFSQSLTFLAEAYLGKPLDKRARISDWEQRPLTKAQLHYAALDAHVLVQIYREMQERYPPKLLIPIVNRCTQKNMK